MGLNISIIQRCQPERKITRAGFNWVSKVKRNCFGFASLRSVIGLKNSATYSTNQMQTQNQYIVTWSHAFSRAWRRLRVFGSSSHWFMVLITFVVIGFSFGFTTLNVKPLYLFQQQLDLRFAHDVTMSIGSLVYTKQLPRNTLKCRTD